MENISIPIPNERVLLNLRNFLLSHVSSNFRFISLPVNSGPITSGLSMEEVEGLAPTRKRKFTKGEVLELLKERGNDLEKVAEEICEELVPFDVNDDEERLVRDRLERMARAAANLEKKIRHLQKCNKERKFRHHPEKLEETVVSCSQSSIFQTDSESFSQELGGGYIIQRRSIIFIIRW